VGRPRARDHCQSLEINMIERPIAIVLTVLSFVFILSVTVGLAP
jgi:hypothetical protein